jgi:gas vesicle protein
MIKLIIEESISKLETKATELKHLVDTSMSAIVIPEKSSEIVPTTSSQNPQYKSVSKGLLVVGAITIVGGAIIASKVLSIAGLLIAGTGGMVLYRSRQQGSAPIANDAIDYAETVSTIVDRLCKTADTVNENWDESVYQLTQTIKKGTEELPDEQKNRFIENIVSTSIIDFSPFDARKALLTAANSQQAGEMKRCLSNICEKFKKAIDKACQEQSETYKNACLE